MCEPLSLAPYSRASTTALAIARTAAAQWGVVSRRQLLECGVSGSVISRWVANGRLHRLYPGVYALGHTHVPYEGRLTAALFAFGAGAGLTSGTGCHWWRVLDRPPLEIHLSVPTRKREVPGVKLQHPRQLEIVRHRRLPVTPLPATLLDYATTASIKELRFALAQADFHGILDEEAVRGELRRGRPGSRKLRAALDRHLPLLARAVNDCEREFLLLCERFSIPFPEVNVWLGRKKVDGLWRDERLVVELDSRSAHGSEARRVADHQRDLELRDLGYRVRRYTWHQVFLRPSEVAKDLRLALGGER